MWRGKWIQVFPWWIFDHIFVCVVFWSCSKYENYTNYHFAQIHNTYQSQVTETFRTCQPMQEHRDDTYKIRSFQSRGTACSAIVLVGYNCSMGLFLCSFLGGIQSLQGISVASIFLPVQQSSRPPTLSLHCKLMNVSQVLHRSWSFVLSLIRCFLSRCLVL